MCWHMVKPTNQPTKQLVYYVAIVYHADIWSLQNKLVFLLGSGRVNISIRMNPMDAS